MIPLHRRFFRPIPLFFCLLFAAIWLPLLPTPCAEAAVTEAAPAVLLPCVMYHHILPQEERLGKYTVSPEEFRADMRFLQREGYTPVAVADLLRFCAGEPLPARPIVITFDDGYESFHRYAAPILQEFGYRAVFSVVGRYADEYSAAGDHNVRYSHATWTQLLELQQSGTAEIQNHSYDLHSLDGARRGSSRQEGEPEADYLAMLRRDLARMQEACRIHLGTVPTAFCYPFGLISPEALPLLREMGFSAAFTCYEQINLLTGNPDELYTLGRFNRPHGKSLEEILCAAQSGAFCIFRLYLAAAAC